MVIEELKTEKRKKIREELYLTIFIVSLLVITSVLFSALLSESVTGFWAEVLAVLLFICLNFLALIILITIKEWSQERKRDKSKINKKEKQRKLSSILYVPIDNRTGEFRNKICPICKLTVGEHQELGQCPECSVIYHMDHLEQWMDYTSLCCVCHYKMKKDNFG